MHSGIASQLSLSVILRLATLSLLPTTISMTDPKHRSLPWLLTLGLTVLVTGWWLFPTLTVWQVPLPIVAKFISSPPAIKAFLNQNPQALHFYLQEMGVEEEIKAFYRPQIQDEHALDQYIHQVFYELSGYVGKAYSVNAQGILEPKYTQDWQFEKWFQLAYQLGIVTGSREEAGIQYVITSAGTLAPYRTVAAQYPLAMLQELKTQQSE